MLSAERTKSIELILGKLKMSNTLIVESLWKCDEEVLKPNIIESLGNAIPLDSEAGTWPKTVDKSTLAAPDLFCIEVLTVKGYEARYQL